VYGTLLYLPAGIISLLIGARLALKGIVQVVCRPQKDDSGRVRWYSGRAWGSVYLVLGSGLSFAGYRWAMYFTKIFPRLLK
jgi:hypothetical protein